MAPACRAAHGCWLGCANFSRVGCPRLDRTRDGRVGPQFVARGLEVAELPTTSLRPVVCLFPLRVLQECQHLGRVGPHASVRSPCAKARVADSRHSPARRASAPTPLLACGGSQRHPWSWRTLLRRSSARVADCLHRGSPVGDSAEPARRRSRAPDAAATEIGRRVDPPQQRGLAPNFPMARVVAAGSVGRASRIQKMPPDARPAERPLPAPCLPQNRSAPRDRPKGVPLLA